jgi:hypothetical protein
MKHRREEGELKGPQSTKVPPKKVPDEWKDAINPNLHKFISILFLQKDKQMIPIQ